MKKLSFYNFYIPLNDDIVLVYNSIQGSYILLRKEIYEYLVKNSEMLDEFQEKYGQTFCELYSNACIIDKDIDELALIRNIRFRRRFNTKEYHLTINPTMNCNLGCWYCYENHIQASKMTPATAERIIKHIECHHDLTQYKHLTIGFFGGEPMLETNTIIHLLTRIKKFCSKNEIVLNLSFTTNGTTISDELLECLNDIPVLFQITFDGDKERHNQVRHYKNTTQGSYSKIIDTFRTIAQKLDNYTLRIRINFDEKTLDSIASILDDLDFLPRMKTYIGVHQVWQVDSSKIDYNKLFGFIDVANSRKFMVSYNPMGKMVPYICYADNLNQAVINYDGSVFKCTARDFSAANAEGILLDNCDIKWDTDKVIKRVCATTPSVCLKCKLYPACIGVCSQKMLESIKEPECVLNQNIDVEDLILINFNQYMLYNELKDC